jgi:hypothetical protein
MRITKDIESTLTVTDDYICNRCGRSCKATSGNIFVVKATGCGGFDSEVFADMHRYSFDFCETCVVDMSRGWKHPPDVVYSGLDGQMDSPPEVTWNETVREFYKTRK